MSKKNPNKMLCINCKNDTYTIEFIPQYGLYRIICTSCKLPKDVDINLNPNLIKGISPP